MILYIPIQQIFIKYLFTEYLGLGSTKMNKARFFFSLGGIPNPWGKTDDKQMIAKLWCVAKILEVYQK